MACKKGFCTHCHGDEKARIFDVNKDADVCYCPVCTAAMKPKEAIGNFAWIISHYLKIASKALFETTEYLLAYQTFAHIIDLDDSIKVAYFGRLLSLVYLSTLREGKISHALLMHRQQAKLFHYQENAREYFHFLWLLLDALDKYDSRMRKRIINQDIFYDDECIVLFLRRTEEIIKYREFIASEAQFFIDANKEQFKAIITRIKNGNDHFDSVFGGKYITAEGKTYTFLDFSKNGTPMINLQTQAKLQKVHHVKPASLNPKDNKKSPIRNEIYQNNLPLSRLVAISVPLAIILFVAVVGGVIASFIVKDPKIDLLIYIICGIGLFASLLLIILHFAWKSRLKKKYYNGTNPFIFK